jgi:hypothetical protein
MNGIEMAMEIPTSKLTLASNEGRIEVLLQRYDETLCNGQAVLPDDASLGNWSIDSAKKLAMKDIGN